MNAFDEQRPGEILLRTSAALVQDTFDAVVPNLREAREVGYDVSRVHLMLDELLSNIWRHGYDGADGQPIGLRLRVTRDLCHVAVRDLAPTFDCVRDAELRPNPDPAQGVPGGMGLFILKRMSLSFTHQIPQQGGNSIYLVMRLVPQKDLEAGGAETREAPEPLRAT